MTPITITCTPGEANILSNALTTYLRLYTPASVESQQVCETVVGSIYDQLRAAGPQAYLEPASLDAAATGGPSNTFNVVSDGILTPWTALSDSPWLTVISPDGEITGSGQVLFAVAANADAQRTGSINITGLDLAFTVDQEAGA